MIKVRKFKLDDADSLYRSYKEQPEKYVSSNPHQNVAQTRAAIEDWIKSYSVTSARSLVFAITIDDKSGNDQAPKDRAIGILVLLLPNQATKTDFAEIHLNSKSLQHQCGVVDDHTHH